jgi:hypothetical protein
MKHYTVDLTEENQPSQVVDEILLVGGTISNHNWFSANDPETLLRQLADHFGLAIAVYDKDWDKV